MPTVSFYLDTRRASGKESTLKLCIAHKRDRSYITLPIKIFPSQWDRESERVFGHERAAKYNRAAMRAKLDAEDAIEEYAHFNDVDDFTAVDFRDVALGKDPKEKVLQESLFYNRFVAFMNRKSGGTLTLYKATLNKLAKFDKDIQKRRFEDITRAWLVRFDDFLATTSPSANARNIHHRNIRAVFNDAIDDEVTKAYPFRRFKLKYEATRKRALTASQLRAFFNAPAVAFERRYLDMFKLMFMLSGINVVDLANLKKTNLANGRIEYVRAKTHGRYSIEVVPEAMEIINQYTGGGGYLLNIMDTVLCYKSFAGKMNKTLSEIGNTRIEGVGGKKTVSPMFPDITTYWARHSWATVAASLDIPKETIAHALGHRSAYSSVTDVYIDFDMRKVDEANRRVIDYVLYDKR